MKLIRFRRLTNTPIVIVNGIRVQAWEIAFNEQHLFMKLDGDFAEVIMPDKPFIVRVWRRFFPLRCIEGVV